MDKQLGSSGHSHTQHLRDGQLRKYARPSFPGSVNTTANISPAVIFSIFFTLLISNVPEEEERGFGAAPECVQEVPRPSCTFRSQMLIEGKCGGRVGRYLSPGENEM